MAEKILGMIFEILAMEELYPLTMLFAWAFVGALFCFITLKLVHNYFLAFIMHQFFILCSIYSLLVNCYKTIDLIYICVAFAVWFAGLMTYGVIVSCTHIKKKYY